MGLLLLSSPLNRNATYYVVSEYMLSYPLGMYFNEIVKGLQLSSLEKQERGLISLVYELQNLDLYKIEDDKRYIRINNIWKIAKQWEEIVDLAYNRLCAVDAQNRIRTIRHHNLLVLGRDIRRSKKTKL